MIRSLLLTATVLLVGLPSGPALAQDDLARFVGADLRDVDFSHANLNGAEFTGADLDGTRFDDADLRNARFVGVHLSAEDAHSATGLAIIHDCTGCSLAGIDLHDADLRGIRVVGANRNDAKLAGARLNDDFGPRTVCANLRGVDLHGIDLRAARHCTGERSAERTCRPVTRAELTGIAHADLTGALAPA